MTNPYSVHKSDGTVAVTVSPDTFDQTFNLILLGRGTSNYGQQVAEDLLHLLENFAFNTPPGSNPNIFGNPTKGQLWYDTSTTTLRFFDNSVAGGSPTGWHGITSDTSVSGVYLSKSQSDAPTVDNSFNLGNASFRWANIYAVNFQGQATSALYADLAERYHADCELEEGDLVSLGGEQEITKTKNYREIDVFGVISLRPAFKMNAGAGDERTHPYVAMTGRVPCKVLGTAKKGQRLVASAIPGVAIALNDDPRENAGLDIFGRILKDKHTTGTELVEVVVGVR